MQFPLITARHPTILDLMSGRATDLFSALLSFHFGGIQPPPVGQTRIADDQKRPDRNNYNTQTRQHNDAVINLQSTQGQWPINFAESNNSLLMNCQILLELQMIKTVTATTLKSKLFWALIQNKHNNKISVFEFLRTYK